MKITGDKFDLKLSSPGDGLQIPRTSYAKETTLDWTYSKDGITVINLQNTGSSELKVEAALEVTAESHMVSISYDGYYFGYGNCWI